jgi:hypothetical protein
MASPERTSQRPGWEDDDDLDAPFWSADASSPSRVVGDDSSSEALPPWSGGDAPDDGSTYQTSRSPARRSQRDPSSTNRTDRDRSAAPWPSLRDSLRGSSSVLDRRSARSRSLSPSASPATSAPTGYEVDEAASDQPGGLEPVKPPRYPPARGGAPRGRARARRTVPTRSKPSLQMPAAVGALVAAQDRLVLGTISAAVLSTLLMVVVVGWRIGSLPSWIVLHVDAAGHPDEWGTASTVWRLPLMTAMLTTASVIAAALVARRDAFAARFLLASTLLVQALAWLGLLQILW